MLTDKDIDEFCKTYGVERRGTGCVKWDSLGERFGDDDLIPMWIADMDFKTVPEVIEALRSRIEHGAFGYGKVPDSYYEAFFAWQKRYGMLLEREQLRFSGNVVNSLYTLIHTFTQPGEAVAVCTPVYYPFSDAITDSGRKIAECRLDNSGGYYTIDTAKFEKTIKENNAKLFILCSPHNPVGRVWTERELEGIFEVCRKHGVIVISDEIHQDFVSPGHSFVPSSFVAGGKYRDMLATLNSGSKTFNLASMLNSHVIIQDEKLRKKYDAYIKSTGQGGVNVLGLIAMEAAFRYGEDWLEKLKAAVYKNYCYMKDQFAARAPKIVVSPLEGTYLVWVDFRGYVAPEETAAFVKNKCRLAVDAGEWFIKKGGEGFIRLNLATLPKYVEIAVNNIINNLIS
jgi:cystathionine beta-lyase